jgi:hypothetical protein
MACHSEARSWAGPTAPSTTLVRFPAVMSSTPLGVMGGHCYSLFRSVFEKYGLALAYFSTITTLGTRQDAMLHEIRAESLFSADDATAQHTWISAG